MLGRDGDLRTMNTNNLRAQTAQSIICENVEQGSTLITGEPPSFTDLSGRYYRHRVNHSAVECTRHFCVHTSGIKSVWAPLKGKIVGIHDFVSPKHLSRYLDEMMGRFNRRDHSDGFRVHELLMAADRSNLSCKALIS